MAHEVSGGHEAGEHESRDPGEEADNDEKAADDFERAGKPHEGKDFNAIGEIFGRREIEILRRAMLKKEQAGDDAEGGVEMAGPGGGDNSV